MAGALRDHLPPALGKVEELHYEKLLAKFFTEPKPKCLVEVMGRLSVAGILRVLGLCGLVETERGGSFAWRSFATLLPQALPPALGGLRPPAAPGRS